jgi:hypothetical protein
MAGVKQANVAVRITMRALLEARGEKHANEGVYTTSLLSFNVLGYPRCDVLDPVDAQLYPRRTTVLAVLTRGT